MFEAMLLLIALLFLQDGSLLSQLSFIVLLLLCIPGIVTMVRSDPPFVPSSKAKVKTMLRLADIHPGEIVYDLGCGDGRLVIAAAREGAKATGFELSAPTFALATFRSLFIRGAHIRFGNFWKQRYDDADVIFCFLLIKAMAKFEREIWPHLKPGCRVVSNAFTLVHHQPLKNEGGVYVYRK